MTCVKCDGIGRVWFPKWEFKWLRVWWRVRCDDCCGTGHESAGSMG